MRNSVLRIISWVVVTASLLALVVWFVGNAIENLKGYALGG